MHEIMVGTLVKLKVPCLDNPAGTVGVCYEAYTIGKARGWSFIFENGNYDGFSAGEIAKFLEITGFAEELSDYFFTNVTRLSQDFSMGTFDSALKG